MSQPNHEIKQRLRAEAEGLGLTGFGVTAVPLDLRRDYYRDWIAGGRHGTMRWMERNNDRRLHPERLIAEARSIVVVGLNYFQPDPSGRRFRIAKYALGDDYHNLILKRLKKLCRILREYGGTQRPYVDTGPLLEKPVAEAAGLGWQGKSTILIEPRGGTWSFLGNIVTTLELPADSPPPDRCGSCTACIDACPTGAITAPYQLDAARCIAYLTIEHDGPIPAAFRDAVGDRLFGCDECLDVCPWNRWARRTAEARFDPRELPDLREMLAWDEARFEAAFRGSPIRRLGLERLRRNICLVLGNVGNREDLPALDEAAVRGGAVVTEQSQWARRKILERCGSPDR